MTTESIKLGFGPRPGLSKGPKADGVGVKWRLPSVNNICLAFEQWKLLGCGVKAKRKDVDVDVDERGEVMSAEKKDTSLESAGIRGSTTE